MSDFDAVGWRSSAAAKSLHVLDKVSNSVALDDSAEAHGIVEERRDELPLNQEADHPRVL
jgi:hypothetical protein